MSKASTGTGLVMVALAGAAALAAGGPDVIVGDLHQVTRWGTLNGKQSYSVGTVSCNIGNQNLLWQANTNRHPVIGQNLYRYKDGRFEQIGQSWLKHGFTALTENLCGQCSGQGGSVLGVGCSDPYSAGLNGSQSGLGPRYQVNPYTGVFPFPVTGVPAATNLLSRRLVVNNDDVNPALNVGARYFVEGQYITQDDAQSGNGENNVSYRETFVSGTGTNFPLSLRPQNPTRRLRTAVDAWKECDPAVTVVPVRVQNEGLYMVGYRVTQTGPSTWRYEYAIQNINSDRAVGSVTMPVPNCGSVTNAGFKDIDYHSGEVWDPTDFAITQANGTIRWATTKTFAQDPNSNALRWGTMYNFWFESSRAPRQGTVTLGLFKPGTPDSITVLGLIPSLASDFDGDGTTDMMDYDAFVTAFESGATSADVDGDGFLDWFDYETFVEAFESGC
jgi:hypothetical protein